MSHQFTKKHDPQVTIALIEREYRDHAYMLQLSMLGHLRPTAVIHGTAVC